MTKCSTFPTALETVFVGLDYSQAFVQVCVLDAGGRMLGNQRCADDWRAIVAYVRACGGPGYVRAAIEACNGAANLADELLQHAGWSLDLAHPGYVQRMKQNPDKTDFSDAHLLADLVRVGYLPRVWLAPHAIRELRRLVRRRQDLANRRRAVKLRIGALLREHRQVARDVRPWTKRWLAWLRALELPTESRWVIEDMLAELADLQGRLQVLERRRAQMGEQDVMITRLLTLPGLGLITASVLRAEIGDARRFRTGKQLSRYCGLTPRNASSGLRQADAGLIAAGNRTLRAALMEAAHRLKRLTPRWKEFAAALEARGKPKSLVTAAVANRWVRGLFHELRTFAA
jgi:transposase